MVLVVVGKVRGFAGAGYSYPSGSSTGHRGTPAEMKFGFLPTSFSSSGTQLGRVVVGVVVVVVVLVVGVVVVVVVVVVMGLAAYLW